MLKSAILRAVIGFAAGFLVACFGLTFLGQLPPGNDLSVPEMEQQTRSLWIAFYFAIGVSLISACVGGRPISRFWLWFCIAFGVVALIPIWPHKNGMLLPLATPYVNSGFRSEDAALLAVHTGVALGVAAVVQHLNRPKASD